MTITQSSTRLVAVAAGSVLALGLLFGAIAGPARAAALTSGQVSAIVALLQSFGADAATVANVTASLNGQPTTTTTTTTTTTGGSCTTQWTRTLQAGSNGADVKMLQQFLNKDASTMVAASGAGSAGMETMTFGPATKAAVMKFQTKYGISAIGIVGPATRAKLNSLCTGPVVVTPPGTTPPVNTGTGLTVMAAAQPANSLAPYGSSRIPFTSFTVTASNDGDVTLNNVTVERQGASTDTAWSGVELIDSATGVQIGTSKTLNSNHQAIIGDTIVIPRGTSKTFMVAANRAGAGSHGGEITSFAVVSVNSSATVNGSFPIVGASNTVNETLVVGSVSTSTSSFDPGAAQTKSIGDTAIRFSGVRFTAGSAEDLKLMNVRWRQVGSVSSSDLANLVTIVNGTSYPTTVSTDGKYFTSVFPGGLLIAKGNSIDAYIQGDVVGSNAASRTVDFDIDKVTDIYFVGQLYGYGVAPSGTYTPWYNGYAFTINAGTATTISNDTTAAINKSQSVALNVSNQPLGGFVTDFKGEAVTENSMAVRISYGSQAASAKLLTSVSLVNESGVTVAGPVDATAVSGTQMVVTFTDTVTFPVGRHTWTIKGKIPSGVATNETVQASTTPSGWGSPTGQVSGNTVSLSGQGAFTMNQMTIKAATFAVTVAATPASNTVIAGTTGLLFANVQLDASQSGEDVRITSIPVRLTVASGAAVGDLNACQLFNGAGVAVNTGSNVPSSLAASGSANSFVLDNSITIPKGTVTTLALKCNLSSSAASTGTYIWSVNSSDTFSATGSSGSSATVTVTTGNSGTMTVGSATFAVTTDPSSPAYTIAAAGTSGVTLGAYKFTATNDAVTLSRVGLSLGSVTASSSPADLTMVSLYNGATLVGTATFTGASRNATSTLTTPVVVPANGSVTLTIKGDLATQGVNLPSHPGALLTVNVDVNGATGNGNTLGVGTAGNVNASGSSAVNGVRVFRTFPTVVKLTQAGTTLSAVTGAELYRFGISANASQDLALNQFVISVATSSYSATVGSTTVTNLKVFAYTDTGLSLSVPGAFTNAQVVSTVTTLVAGNNTMTISPILIVPKGSTYYFKVVGDVTQAGGTAPKGTVTTKLIGDSAYPSLATTLLDTTTLVGSNFVWSPMSTSTTAATTNQDWTNGYSVVGLPSGGTDGNQLTN